MVHAASSSNHFKSNQISEAAKHAYHPHMSTELLDLLFVCSLQFHMCRTVGFLGNLWRLKAQEDVAGSMEIIMYRIILVLIYSI